MANRGVGESKESRSEGAAQPEEGAAVSGVGQEEYGSEIVRQLEVGLIDPNPGQFRKIFKGMEELIESVGEKGVKLPIKVLQKGDGRYRIIYGERRWRAAVSAGLHYMPAIVVESGERGDIDEICLIENLHRENLPAVDEAMALHEFKLKGYKEKQIGTLSGRSIPHISRALSVAEFLRDAIGGGFITYKEVAEMELSIYSIYKVALAARDVENLAYGADLLKKAHEKHMKAGEMGDEADEEKYAREVRDEYEDEVKRMKEDAINRGVTTGPLLDEGLGRWDKNKILTVEPPIDSPEDEDFLYEGGGLSEDLLPGGGTGAEGRIEMLGHPDAPVRGGDRQKAGSGEARPGVLSGRKLLKCLVSMHRVADVILGMKIDDMAVKKKDREKVAKLADGLATMLDKAGKKMGELKTALES